MENPEATRKISKWASELRSYRLKYETRTSIKSQVLADFITDFTLGTTEHADQPKGWILNTNGASNSKESGIEIVLTTPKGSIIEQSFTLGFNPSNNKAKSEAVLAELRMAVTLRVTGLEFTVTPRW